MVTAPARSPALDALRGFALFGILCVNLPFLAATAEQALAGPGPAAGWLDRMADGLVAFAFEAKFFVLFSFLFGFGLAAQMQRNANAGPQYVRRLIGLFALGALHSVLFFVGDILLSYAILGAGLFALRNRTPATLLALAGLAYLLALAAYAALPLLSGAADLSVASAAERTAFLGSYADAVRERIAQLPFALSFIVFYNWPTAFAMFLLGYTAGRGGWLQDPRAFVERTARYLAPAALIGVVGSAWFTLDGRAPGWHGSAAMAALALSAPCLSFVYLQLVLRLALHRPDSRLVRGLAIAGRMSLTNYIAQSVVAGLIFHGHGLGLYDSIGPAGLFAIGAAIFVLQMIGSSAWLRRFCCGPDEWLLRSWARLRWQPFVKVDAT